MKKVGLYRVTNEDIQAIIDRGFREIGFDERLKTARTVFLKPNLVTDVAEYIREGANTDVRVIEAVLRALTRYPGLRIVLGESETGTNVKGRRLDRALELMGVLELRKKYHFEICNLTFDEQVQVVIPNGTLIKTVSMGRTLMESDLIINLPKIKTHKYATITCALKNMFGTIPDPKRVVWHRDIHWAVSDINRLFYGRMLVVTDGITAMEGAGPLFGSKIDLGIILVADDPVANDLVACRLMGIPSESVRHLAFCRSWTGVRPDMIEILGDVTIEAAHRQFAPAKQNAFIWIEGRLMQHRWIVSIVFNEWFQRNITFRFRSILKKFRGGSYTWYIEEKKNRKDRR